MQQYAAGPASSKVLYSNAIVLQHAYVCVTASYSIQQWQQQQQQQQQQTFASLAQSTVCRPAGALCCEPSPLTCKQICTSKAT